MKKIDPKWVDPATAKKMAGSMVDLYDALQTKFPPDDANRHLLLTPRDLSLWAFGLLRYDLRKYDPLTAFSYELMRLFADRLPDSVPGPLADVRGSHSSQKNF